MTNRLSCAVVLAFLFASPAAADICKLPRLAHADFVAQPDGTLLLPVSINGQTEYFTLGGGAHSFVYEDDADRLDFGHHHYDYDDGLYFGEDPVKVRRTADLIIGKVRWRALEFYPMHIPHPPGVVAIGSLGMNFLASSQMEVEINTGARSINFILAGACSRPPWALSGDGASLAPMNGDTSLPVLLDGRRFSGIFGTGTLTSSMDVQAFAQVFERLPESGLPRELDTLTIDETLIQHPVIQMFTYDDQKAREALAYVERRARALNPGFMGKPPVSHSSADGVVWLGLSELNRMRIYLMFGQHKVFVTPVPNAPNTGIAPPAPDPGPEVTEQSH
ncbi:MAG: hypothetical protein ISS15_20170 [Alphaproteobacteria bacterium]|nr:hypothetical protein [Alphaproteobacteria bacterium]